METTRLTGFREADPEEQWQHQFRELEAMRNNIDFHLEELTFLRHLIDKHLMWLMEESGMDHLKAVTSRIGSSSESGHNLLDRINGLIGKTGSLIENPFAQDEHQVRIAHTQTRQAVEDYTVGLRTLKKEVFTLVEEALRTEKARHLLSPVPPANA